MSMEKEGAVALYDSLWQLQRLQCNLKTVTGDPRYDTQQIVNPTPVVTSDYCKGTSRRRHPEK